MSGLLSNFTERRRAKLGLKVNVLELLESRSTVTEPISIVGLSAGMIKGLAFLNPLLGSASGFVAQRPKTAHTSGPRRYAVAGGINPREPLPFAVASRNRAGGSSTAAREAAYAKSTVRSNTPRTAQWLLETARRPRNGDGSTHEGPSPALAKQPLSRTGGGGTLGPRGGSGGGALRGVVQPLRFPQASANNPTPTAVGVGSAPAIVATTPSSLGVAAGSAPGGFGSTSMVHLAAIGDSGGTAVENFVGGDSSSALAGFTNFPLYVLDYNNGSVLFPGFYQYATIGNPSQGWVDLRAQVRDTAITSYSWDTSGLTQAINISGASTYRLQFKWGTTTVAQTNSVTLTATNSAGQHEVQTFTFWVPVGMSTDSGGAPAVTWPNTLSPDAVTPGAAAFDSHYVDVDANSGALGATLALPSYNSNVAPLVFQYDSTAADPRPLIVVHHPLDPALSTPSKTSVQLTFNGSAGSTYYYATSAFNPGDYAQFAVQADATGLATGRYSYSTQVVDYRATNTTATYSGTVTVVDAADAPFGAIGQGWSIQGLNRIVSATGGVILDTGSNDRLWFATAGGSGGSGGSTSYTSPAGDFSVLVQNPSGTYTRTLKDGTKQEFDAGGYETAAVDRNNLRITYTYDGSQKLINLTDPYGKVTTLGYDANNKLQTVEDPAGRVTTITHSGGTLTGAVLPDDGTWSYAYDGSGRMTSVTDPRSKVVTAAYDAASRVGTITRPDATTQAFNAYQERGYDTSGTSGSPAAAILLAEAKASVVDPRGNTTDLRMDWRGLGKVEQTTDAAQYVSTANRDADGLATITVDRLNRISLDTYDSNGNPLTHTYADGNVEGYTYNGFSEPLTHTDANGKTTTFGYDANGNLTSTYDPLGNRTTTTYTATGRVSTVKDARNNVTTYQYDSQDQLTTVTYPDATTKQFAYDSKGNAVTVVDERGNATTYAFDAMNRRTGVKDALGNRTTNVYDSGGNLTQVEAPLSRTTNYAYDSMNRLTTLTDPLSHAVVSGYDASGNLATVKDALNRVTTYGYDALNRKTVVTDPSDKSTTTVYDAEGQAVQVTDRLGRVTATTYNARGWAQVVVDPLNHTTTYNYTATGKIADQSDANSGGSVSLFRIGYDALDRRVTLTDALGETTTTTYDAVGNVQSKVDPNGNRTTYAYDSRNRLTTVTDPLSHDTAYGYDSAGNRQTVKDALGNVGTTLYDALNRATTILDGMSGQTTMAYDAAGRRTGLTDPDGNRTTWAYDAADRLTTLTDALGTETYVYDNANQLTDQTDRDLRRVTFAYDGDGRRTGEQWFGTGARLITYTYDDEGQLTGVKDPDATLTFTYDSGGNLTTAATSGPGTGQPTVTLTYGYNASHDRTSVADSLSTVGRTTTTYDAAYRPALIQQSFGATAGPYVAYEYDAAGRLTTMTRAIGGAGTAVLTVNSYDSADRLGTIVHSAGTPLATFVYMYDDANRVTTQVDAEGTTTFAYDSADQLTTVVGARSETYGYDANGNRNTTGYAVISGNRYSSGGGNTYTYDSEGNVTGERETTTGDSWTYAYDHRNRQTSAIERDSGGTVISAATYTYDALGRRIGTNVDADGAGAGAAVQSWTVYDGDGSDANPYADFTAAGALGVRYLYGPAVDAILARTSSGGTSAWYLSDKLGTIRNVANTSGAVIDHVVYDSFGKVISETGPTNGDRFKFTGREYDVETGNYYYRARFYDPTIGRFMGQDPKSFAAGDYNLYRYVGNGPTDRVDPSGLDAQAADAQQAAMMKTGDPTGNPDFVKKQDRVAYLESLKMKMYNATTQIAGPLAEVKRLETLSDRLNGLTAGLGFMSGDLGLMSLGLALVAPPVPAALLTGLALSAAVSGMMAVYVAYQSGNVTTELIRARGILTQVITNARSAQDFYENELARPY